LKPTPSFERLYSATCAMLVAVWLVEWTTVTVPGIEPPETFFAIAGFAPRKA
jgi:hypothetical protein